MRSVAEGLNLCHGKSGETFIKRGQEVKSWLGGPGDEIFDELCLSSVTASNQL